MILNTKEISNIKVLIVEDDLALQEAIQESLEYEGVEVVTANNGEAALKLLANENVHLVVSDINMPKMNGEALLLAIRQDYPLIPVLLMTAYSSVDRAVNAIQKGAVDYLAKPFSPQDLTDKVRRYSQHLPRGSHQLNRSTSHAGEGFKTGVTSEDSSEKHSINQPICEDCASHQLFQMAQRVAQSNTNVLISGESGTGKEVLARFIHDESARHSKPFIAINCAAIPENMLEAILFGHEKGAFTGAHKSMPGKFELADGGTLLLDEVTEMPLSLQAKILRVLQEREVERIGGKQPIRVNVRILSTTNRDLLTEVAEKRFREDLFYRLNVFPLHWMPLRERQGDIIPLAQFLLTRHLGLQHASLKGVQEANNRATASQPLLSPQAQDKLLEHTWPGNVRELDNVMQRALVLCQGEVIQATDLLITADDHQIKSYASTLESSSDLQAINTKPVFRVVPTTAKRQIPHSKNNYSNVGTDSAIDPEQGDNNLFSGDPLGEDLRTHEFKIILAALEKFNGNRKQTAEHLQISPRTLRYKIAKMKKD